MQNDTQYLIGHHIGRTARSFQEFFIKELKAHNLSFEQGVILFMVSENPKIHISHIARELHKDKATISREANSLVNKGLFVKTQDSCDKRTMLLTLTPNGENALNLIKDKIKKLESLLFSRFSQDEINTCLNVLENMRLAIKESLQE
ncbi:MarR family winged helix-turn-helix transcriptional regulator [Helicobacter cinaedi]|uniref:Putative MarR family transcriptional regulator n=1 Tax=Helicobacter cinaedi TaxID=213 RepID=A0A377JVZ8_9HELI|nr:MarR family transcriptional regulator [Helicobacter cinaedi]STP09009.1 putative MarR family transcriptional regulator [Helicobacter cinaedi]STP11435.1 putative MarR family transcriptional regulator [Helicobacter cinaedi]